MTTVALGLCLVASVLVSPGRAAAQARPKLTVLMGSAIHQTSMFVAEAKGLFKGEGVDVSLIRFSTGAEAMESFRAGLGQILMAGDFPSMTLWAMGEAVGVAPVLWNEEIPVVVAKRDIRSPGDLRGKRVATRVGSTYEFFVYRYLESGGLSKDDVKLINLSPPEMLIALDRGEIDAYAWNEPFGMRALSVSGDRVHILTTGKGFFTEWILLSVNRAWGRENRDALVAFLRAVNKANRAIKEQTGDVEAIVIEYTKIEPGVVKKLLPLFNFDLSYTSRMKGDMDTMARFMIGRGTLAKPINWQDQFDPSFLRAVDASLVGTE